MLKFKTSLSQKGETEAQRSEGFPLALTLGGWMWGLIFQTENQDESLKECVR